MIQVELTKAEALAVVARLEDAVTPAAQRAREVITDALVDAGFCQHCGGPNH